MRSRSGSGVRLDRLMHVVERTILVYQDPATGLISNSPDFPEHAWVRDNVYAALAVWGMYRAYQKSADFDEDVAKANELGLTCVKIMQSLMECLMRQADKVEEFKQSQRRTDALHAKYSARTKATVAADDAWGHLQIDATSLFLLSLAQMSASGLQIVRNFDEIAFIQNLVFYIERAYMIPDYGVWERGDKTNQGIVELNASSIGMAKAALQALNDVGDLFGDGSKASVIHVLPDEIQQCAAVLKSMLPRESFSKETDASLLSIIGFPAFAVEDAQLVAATRDTIVESLFGHYGCRRFLRDGYKTVLEDPNRLYYNNAELQQFENIECEWPLFVCMLLLNAIFGGDADVAAQYWQQLEALVLRLGGVPQMPELYAVARDAVAAEALDRGSQQRAAAGSVPFLWAQSLFVLSHLLTESFLSPAELDPLSRRLSSCSRRPPTEVQVVVLAESADVQSELRRNDLRVQRVDELESVFSLQPASVLAKILAKLGCSEKMGLTGRPLERDVGLLSTSKLYQLGSRFIVFTPQFMEQGRSHLMYDIRIMVDEWRSELQYIHSCWNDSAISGRPLVLLVITKNMLDAPTLRTADGSTAMAQRAPVVVGTLKKLKSGYLAGARVVMKDMLTFFRTTAVSKLEFADVDVEELLLEPRPEKAALPSAGSRPTLRRLESLSDKKNNFTAIHKASLRHRSIMLDANDGDLQQLRSRYAAGQLRRSPAPPTIRVEEEDSSDDSESRMLRPSPSLTSVRSSGSRIDLKALEELKFTDVVAMLNDTDFIEEQCSILHFLWMKKGPDWDTRLNAVVGVTVRKLMNELYAKVRECACRRRVDVCGWFWACESREWMLVRLSAGLLEKKLDDLPKAVTHLLVRQKQITVGMPSINEVAITVPKSPEQLRSIMQQAYGKDPNSNMLAQEVIVCLSSLVRVEPKLFVEMFRLRIGLIIQVLASELARVRNVSVDDASRHLLGVGPYELKCMLFSLISGRLLEDAFDEEVEERKKDHRSGLGVIRRQIEERKSLRASMHGSQFGDDLFSTSVDDDDEDASSGFWLRHRRIDGALNRVPADFYEHVWETVRRFPGGLKIAGIPLNWGLTQEMTRRETKFALEVETVLNRIPEPEYREMIVEALSLLSRVDCLLRADVPRIPSEPFEVDRILTRANDEFVKHSVSLDTVVVDCCGAARPTDVDSCGGARRLCVHFYDCAPAGEFGSAHYIIRALLHIFAPDD